MWDLIIKRYWQVALFREGPENTPYSPFLFILVSVLFFLVIIVQWHLADLKNEISFSTSLIASLTLLCSYYLYTYVLLKINHKTNRTLQTLTTLLFCHLIVHFFVFPLLLASPLLSSKTGSYFLLLIFSIMYLLLTLALSVWQFLLTMHIYKKALDLDFLPAALASVGLLACNILTVSFWQ